MMNQYPESNPWETLPPDPPEEPPRQPRRKRYAGLLTAVFFIALIASVLGTFLGRYISDPSQAIPAPAAENAQVTLRQTQTTATSGQPLYESGLVEQVAANCLNSVVEVSTESRVTHAYFRSYVTGGAGSGVIISEDGYILTNDHVVSGMDSIAVRLPDGTLYEATLVGADPQTDLAVLRINATGLTPATFADSDSVRVGEPAIAIGNPLGTLGGTVTEGIISARDREIIIGGEAMVLLQTSAAISPGNSGGGLFNRDGALVGVVNAKSSSENVEGIGFAIPANTALGVATELIEKGYVSGRPVLGVEAITISSYDALFRYRVNSPGVYITSAGEESGLRSGDQIIGVAETAINSVSDIKTIVGQYDVGDSVQVHILRNGRQSTVTLPLRERGAESSDQLV